jgi:hypothetical protein
LVARAARQALWGNQAPLASYYCSSTISLGAGTYDMVIAMKINRTPATARTLRFTVGG